MHQAILADLNLRPNLSELEQKLITRNTRPKRSPKPDSVEEVDRGMTIKLAELNADKLLPQNPLPLSVSTHKMKLASVDTSGLLHFTDEAGKDLQPTTYGSLPLPDRAILSLSLTEDEPQNLFLYGIAAFYLECAGSPEAADYFYGKAGPAIANQFGQFFE